MNKQAFSYEWDTCIGANNERLMWRFVDFIVQQNKRFLLFRVQQKDAARKSVFFCIRYFSKTKTNPVKKKYRAILSAEMKSTCKISANLEQKKQQQPKSSLIPFYD